MQDFSRIKCPCMALHSNTLFQLCTGECSRLVSLMVRVDSTRSESVARGFLYQSRRDAAGHGATLVCSAARFAEYIEGLGTLGIGFARQKRDGATLDDATPQDDRAHSVKLLKPALTRADAVREM